MDDVGRSDARDICVIIGRCDFDDVCTADNAWKRKCAFVREKRGGFKLQDFERTQS